MHPLWARQDPLGDHLNDYNILCPFEEASDNGFERL